MTIHCKICGTTFKIEDYACSEDLMCPLLQFDVVPEDKPEDTRLDKKKGEQAPTDSPQRIDEHE